MCNISVLCLQILGRFNRARAARLTLPHFTCQTPLFMPVGTQGLFLVFLYASSVCHFFLILYGYAICICYVRIEINCQALCTILLLEVQSEVFHIMVGLSDFNIWMYAYPIMMIDEHRSIIVIIYIFVLERVNASAMIFYIQPFLVLFSKFPTNSSIWLRDFGFA